MLAKMILLVNVRGQNVRAPISQLWWRTLAGRVSKTGETLLDCVSFTRSSMDWPTLKAPAKAEAGVILKEYMGA